MNDEFRMEQRTVNQRGNLWDDTLLKPLAGCLRDCL